MHPRRSSGAGRSDGRPLTRRDFLRLAGVFGGGAVLSSCGGAGSGTGASSGGTVELVYQDWRTPWFPPMAQEMLEQFHAEHPNIRVYYSPDPVDYEREMLDDFEGGTAADVFQGCCTHFPIWAQRGYTLDLRPYVEADLDPETISDWDPAQYNAFFTQAGVQYGLPKYHGALALYYNKDLFDARSVDYPDATWDHDDYREAMLRLAQDTDGDGVPDIWGSIMDISWDRVQVHVNGWGGHLVDPEDPSRPALCDPEALAALEWLRARVHDDRVLTTPSAGQPLGTRELFAAGRTAMSEDGSWALRDILETAEFRVGVAPFPAGPARRATIATTDGFGIFAGTRHPDEAWELLKFLISKDYGRAMARANFLQPARASLVPDWVDYIRQDYPEQTAEMNLDAFAEGHIQGYSVVAEVFPHMDQARQIAYEAWDQIFVLGQSLSEQMADACQRIDQAEETLP